MGDGDRVANVGTPRLARFASGPVLALARSKGPDRESGEPAGQHAVPARSDRTGRRIWRSSPGTGASAGMYSSTGILPDPVPDVVCRPAIWMAGRGSGSATNCT